MVLMSLYIRAGDMRAGDMRYWALVHWYMRAGDMRAGDMRYWRGAWRGLCAAWRGLAWRGLRVFSEINISMGFCRDNFKLYNKYIHGFLPR